MECSSLHSEPNRKQNRGHPVNDRFTLGKEVRSPELSVESVQGEGFTFVEEAKGAA